MVLPSNLSPKGLFGDDWIYYMPKSPQESSVSLNSPPKTRGLVIDGVAASEAVDTSGEILYVKGADISSLNDGTGSLNWEHRKDDSPGASANDVVGAVLFARKVFRAEDCKTENEKKYWNDLKLPFIYFQAELFDAEGHPGAVALAAVFRYYHRRKKPILTRYSIEGSTIERDGHKLVKTIARRIAVTVKPCNKSCKSNVIYDPLEPAQPPSALAALAETLKAQSPLATLGQHETRSVGVVTDNEGPEIDVDTLVEKAEAAGAPDVAPSAVTDAISRTENAVKSLAHKHWGKKLWAKARDWQGELVDFALAAKAEMPELDEDYLKFFVGALKDYKFPAKSLKKTTSDKEFVPRLLPTHPAIRIAEDPQDPAHRVEYHGMLVKRYGHFDPNPRNIAKDRKHREYPLLTQPLFVMGRIPEITAVSREIARRPIRPGVSRVEFEGGSRPVLHTSRGSFAINDFTQGPHSRSVLLEAARTPSTKHAWRTVMRNWRNLRAVTRGTGLPDDVIRDAAVWGLFSSASKATAQDSLFSAFRQVASTGETPWENPKAWWVLPHTRDTYKEYRQYPKPPKGPVIAPQGEAPPRYVGARANAFIGRIFNEAIPANYAVKHVIPPGMSPVEMARRAGRYGLWDADFRAAVRANELNTRGLVSALHALGKSDTPQIHPNLDPNLSEYARPYGVGGKVGALIGGMLGGGDLIVPDIHLIRNLFGLHPRSDRHTVSHIQELLSHPNNTKALFDLSDHYRANHPLRALLNEEPYAEMLRGVPLEHQAFPLFYLNWLAAPGYAHNVGLAPLGTAGNRMAFHGPLWQSINRRLYQDFLKKSGDEAAGDVNVFNGLALHLLANHPDAPEANSLSAYYNEILPRYLDNARMASIVKHMVSTTDLIESVLGD